MCFLYIVMVKGTSSFLIMSCACLISAKREKKFCSFN